MTKQLTYEIWDDYYELPFDIDNEFKGSLEVLNWAYDHYQNDIVYACSFGAEGVVLIDLIHQVNQQSKIIFLDTNLHFRETYELIDQIKERYQALQIEFVNPLLSIEDQKERFGDRLWEQDPNQCCHIRKIAPLEKVLQNKKAWISGLRREQSLTRKYVQFINRDEKFQSIKICPLIHWTWKDIWRYIHKNNLSYNLLHDKGYPSIGCQMCTKPIYDESDLRSGRWAGTQKLECGLHQS